MNQAAEQLNAWITGYQPILNRMTVANFKWYVLVLLFLHARIVQERITAKSFRPSADNQATGTDAGTDAEEEDEEEADQLAQEDLV